MNMTNVQGKIGLYHEEAMKISHIISHNRKINLMRKVKTVHKRNTTTVYGKCELDSHADTTVVGNNCIISHYTGKQCDVSPYRDDYESIRDVPIVTAATAWQSKSTGETFILIINEAIWMGDSMDTTLINPNQLRYFGIKVQDNPVSKEPLSIVTENDEFSINLQMEGTIISFTTRTPTDREMLECTHIHLTSPHDWEPKNVKFPMCNTLEVPFEVECINVKATTVKLIYCDEAIQTD